MSGWNGSGQRGNSTPIQPKVTAKKPSPVRGLIAGLIVCALAAAAAYFLLFSGDQAKKPVRKEAKKELIKEVTPAAAPKPQADTNYVWRTNRHGQVVKRKPPETYIDENGIERYKGGARVPRKNPKVVKLPTGRAVEFKHFSENAIEGVITIEPGDIVVGEITYGDDFIKDFNDSLAEQIKIEETDTPYQRQIKEDVIAAKKELYEAMNRGEDIGKIMTDARKEMRRLFELQSSIENEVRSLLEKEENTPQDIDDITAAANKMLKEKGLPELKMPKSAIRRMKRRIEKKNQGANK